MSDYNQYFEYWLKYDTKYTKYTYDYTSSSNTG